MSAKTKSPFYHMTRVWVDGEIGVFAIEMHKTVVFYLKIQKKIKNLFLSLHPTASGFPTPRPLDPCSFLPTPHSASNRTAISAPLPLYQTVQFTRCAVRRNDEASAVVDRQLRDPTWLDFDRRRSSFGHNVSLILRLPIAHTSLAIFCCRLKSRLFSLS